MAKPNTSQHRVSNRLGGLARLESSQSKTTRVTTNDAANTAIGMVMSCSVLVEIMCFINTNCASIICISTQSCFVLSPLTPQLVLDRNRSCGKLTAFEAVEGNMRILMAAIGSCVLAACASTDVTQLSRNEIVVNTSAAPLCGTQGARNVVARMAAIESIRRGFDRFVIVGAENRNNVVATGTGPTSASTTGQATTFGNRTNLEAETTYRGAGVQYSGTYDSSLLVHMLAPGDAGYDQGVDARAVLGPEWQALVAKGINRCR